MKGRACFDSQAAVARGIDEDGGLDREAILSRLPFGNRAVNAVRPSTSAPTTAVFKRSVRLVSARHFSYRIKSNIEGER